MTFADLHVLLQDLITSLLKDNNLNTPILLFSDKVLKGNIQFFSSHIAIDDIYFPVKTNNQIDILRSLKGDRICFEAASLGELQLLKSIGVSSEDILFGNPIKINDHIKFAAHHGITTFCVDTESELVKIANHTKNADVYLRLAVANDGATWDLSDKFGCEPIDAVRIFQKAIDLALNPVGLSFHVGWNNSNIATWERALIRSYQVIQQCRDVHIYLKFINIGGGFPAHLNDQYGLLDQISRAINPHLLKIKNEFHMKVYAEPGSFLTTNAGVVISRVIDVIKRNNQRLAYLDTGINQGFSWIMAGLQYEIFSPVKNQSPSTEYAIFGPTCDSHDVFSHHALLSEELKQGDLLLIYPAGAYVSSSKEYNGFDYPVTMVY